MAEYPKGFDTERDLFLERIVDLPAHIVWEAWTIPENLMQWFTPKPWKTIACTMDIHTGGRFLTTMQSPEGESFENTGCILIAETNRKLVWTDAMTENFRPSEDAFMTATLTLTPSNEGTLYQVWIQHASIEDKERHESMGFHAGWNTALDQLIEFAKRKLIGS